MKVFYIGGFPPPYGGVTTKNSNLFIALHNKIDIEKIDLNEIKRKNIIEIVRIIKELLNKDNRFVIGVAGKKTRRNFCRLMYFVNKKAMRKSIIFLMGGTAADDIVSDAKYKKYISQFKCVYVETYGMINTLEQAGLTNAGYYPNCRFKPTQISSNEQCIERELKCVFFSSIRKEKGVDIVLSTAKLLPEMSFSFYGPIEENYKSEFFTRIRSLSNVVYYGVFSGSKDEVYQELGKFDVLLFPTRYDIEGVPGILIESKIAGITCVVSDKSYNAEIIKNAVEGIVLEKNSAEELKKTLVFLSSNRKRLSEYKKHNFESANHFYIEKYIDQIIEKIGG